MSVRCTVGHRCLALVLVVSTLSLSLRSLVLPYALETAPVDRAIEIYVDVGVVAPDPPLAESPEQRRVHADDPPIPAPAPTADAQRPLGTHTRTPDGLLVVNPEGPHPIFELIREAEAAWADKLARASTTLEQAVAEYKRRYHRAPPRGFDQWWAYAMEHHVQLPDEYDEIYQDLEAFWGIDPAELQRAQAASEAHLEVVTIVRAGDGLEVVASTLPADKPQLRHTADAILALVRDVAHQLPPLRMTLSPNDNPSMLSDWRIKTMAREAAANGPPLSLADLPHVSELGWIQACPPDSPARTGSGPAFDASRKTFIASHRTTMDPCLHPALLDTHGQFLSHNQGPFPQATLVPRFSLCATVLHHDIRPPVPYGWEWDADADALDDDDDKGAFKEDLPWKDRVDERVGWRGRTTGMHASPQTPWEQGHRARLVTLANALEGNASVLGVPENADEAVGEPETVRLSWLNPAWMDMAFTDKPVGCDRSAGTCGKMEDMWEFRRVQPRREEGRYKFILDVDGNGWSGRFKRLMTSNALVFKTTIYPEWYTSRIMPWVHYVPIQVSYADLYDATVFFRMHDDLAARIAKAGRNWSRRYWRRQDMTAYLYRLLLEYARVTSLDRTLMDYEG